MASLEIQIFRKYCYCCWLKIRTLSNAPGTDTGVCGGFFHSRLPLKLVVSEGPSGSVF